MRAAYGVDKLNLTGAGQTIVIIDAYQSPTITSDLATFDNVFGLPAPPALNIIAPDGLTPFDQSDPNQTGWAGEITLDVEYAHAIAPGATIDLVLAKSSNDPDIFSAEQYVADHTLGGVVSMSYGEAEQCQDPTIAAETQTLFAGASHAGMSWLAASADQGAAQPTCDGTSFFKAVSTPASDPNVTGVGGTILDANGSTGAYNGEVVWNEPDFAAAGGGGYSTTNATPSYQQSLGLPMRGVPDVAYNAAIVGGVLAVWSTSGQGANLVFQFGGTSAGSPQWAGLVALADQLAGHPLGAINPTLYKIASDPSFYASEFHDITVGDNTFHGAVTIPGYPATSGWDPASGLGSPQAAALVPRLAYGDDVAPPVITCGAPDGLWHKDNVSIQCTASDSGSGLADPSQASFTLTTSVPAGQATSNAQTNSVQVCDKLNNCATAGPISGIKVDRASPTVTLTTPADGATYSLVASFLRPVRVRYSCSDVGSGIASCTGTIDNGDPLVTGLRSLGTHTFTVTATDKAGNVTTVTHTYRVVF
ncbi:MAG TPA: S53 family peptidase [Solirubrobacteraceae bacterium]|jgi:hypothetical protein|nr:S53 family peptidase [Solirubrobacteraceae bacterium]